MPAVDAPAFWDAALCPYVVILGAAPPGIPATSRFDPACWPQPAHRYSGPEGTHLVLGGGASFYRVWLRGARRDGPLAAIVPFDAMTATRLAALSDFDRWRRGASAPAAVPRLTAYQAQRLDLLLSILDLRQAARATSHAIASRLVYPRLATGRGAVWKASPERRRTQRLIREAEALVAGGYRALLSGRAGRQK